VTIMVRAKEIGRVTPERKPVMNIMLRIIRKPSILTSDETPNSAGLQPLATQQYHRKRTGTPIVVNNPPKECPYP
jgi:hypothetical protein